MSEQDLSIDPKYITSKEAGKLYRVTHDYIARLARRGKVEGKLVGRTWYINVESLAGFMGQHDAEAEEKKKRLAEERKEEYKAAVSSLPTTVSSFPTTEEVSAPVALQTGALHLPIATESLCSTDPLEVDETSVPTPRPYIRRAQSSRLVTHLSAPVALLLSFVLVFGGYGVLANGYHLEGSSFAVRVVQEEGKEAAIVARDTGVAVVSLAATNLMKGLDAEISLPTLSAAVQSNFFSPVDTSGLFSQAYESAKQKITQLFGGRTTEFAQGTSSPESSPVIVYQTVNQSSSPTTVIQNPVQVIERTVFGFDEIALDQKLETLANSLKAEIYRFTTSQNFSGPAYTTPATTQTVAFSNKIDSLSGITLSNVTFEAGTTISGLDLDYLPLAGGDLTGIITNSATATSSFAGGFSASVFNASSTTATSTFANGITLTGGCFSIDGTCVGSGSGSPGGASGTLQFNDSGNFGGSSSLVWDNSNLRLGVGTSSPYAPLSVVGEAVASFFTATTTATSTFTGGLNVAAINQTGSATSTFANGIDLTGGCFSVDGTCITGSSAAAFAWTPGTFGSTAANSTSTLIGFTNGIYALASSTIGAGTQVGGLTVSGGATTTGNAYFGGNVGVGATAPDALLTLGGGAIHFVLGARNAYIGDADLLPIVPTGGPTTADFYITGGTNNDFFIASQANGSGEGLRFGNASGAGETFTEYMTILGAGTGAGNVGIGTTSPYAKLSVVGEVVASFFTATTTATSTFTGGLNVAAINQTGSATSTFANGLNLTGGCFSINDTCVTGGGSSASSTLLADVNTFTGANTFSSTTLSGNTLLTSATTTNFGITGIISSLLKTNSDGSVTAAVAGTDYANFAFPWTVNSGYNSTTTGLGIFASTTIGAGGQATGLTISGGATTTATSTLAGIRLSSSWIQNCNGASVLETDADGNITCGTDAGAAGGGLASTDIDTSSEIAAIVGDETGSGSLVFGTGATLASTTLTGNFVFANATGTNATTTSLAIGNIASGSLLKATTGGSLLAAVAGTDFENALTFTYPLSRSTNTISLAFGTTTTSTWVHQIFDSLFATNASSTNATTTNLHISSLTSTLLSTDGNGRVQSTSASSPLSFSGSTLSIQNAGADGSTKGAASFAANDFDASSGNISIDYTNGQKASGSQAGFLTSADWTVFNQKISSTSLSATFPLAYNSSTGAFTFSGLSTTTDLTPGRIPYVSGVNTFADIATGTISVPTGLTATANRYVLGGNLSLALDTGYVIPLQSTLDSFATFSYPFPASATSSLVTFTGGILSTASTTFSGNATTTGMHGFGSIFLSNDLITDLVGTGLTLSGTTLTASLGTNIAAAEIADGDHGFFSYSSGVASLDTGGLTSANLAGGLSDETGSGSAVFGTGATLASTTLTGNFVFANATGTNATTTNLYTSGTATIGSLSGLIKATSGVLSAAVAGTDYLTSASLFGKAWEVTSGYLAPTSTIGILVNASSTIGNGSAGLTISGTATTTGRSYFGGNIGIGSSTPWGDLSIVNAEATPNLVVVNSFTPDSLPFLIDDAGEVGIGTLSPSNPLHIKSASGGTDTTVRLEDGDGGYATIDSTDGTLTFSADAGNANAGTYQAFLIDGTERARLTATGLGIGTTSPYAKLSVVGEVVGAYFTATTTATSTFPNLNISSQLQLGSSYITDLVGTGLTLSGTTLTASLGTNIAAAEIADGDHGFFSYSSGVASLDTGGLTSANLAGGLSDETGSGSAVFGTGATLASTTLTGNFVFANATGTNATTTSLAIGNISSGSLLKATTGGSILAAVAGTDFENVLTFGDGLTRTTNDVDCDTASGSVFGCLASADWTVFNQKISSSSLSATFPLAYNSSTGAFTFSGLSTTTDLTPGRIPYVSGVNTFADIATGTISVPTGLTATANRYVLGGNLSLALDTGYVIPLQSTLDGFANFSYLFPSNATTTGLGIYASTTIGAGTQTTGLTISGGATTTGDHYIGGTVKAGGDTYRLGNTGLSYTSNSNWFVDLAAAGTSIQVGGNIGVNGTTSPWANLSIEATAGEIPFAIGSSTATYFVVNSTGNVGIGTTTPTQRLEISGAIDSNTSGIGLTDTQGGRTWWLTSGVQGVTTHSFGIKDQSAGLYRLIIDTNGQIGIGTSTPWRKLSVTDTSAQAVLAYDTTRYTSFSTDSAGDLTVDAQGGDAFLLDENLWVCTGGACPTGTPSSTGTLVVETAIGVGTSTPAAAGHALAIVKDSAGSGLVKYQNSSATGYTSFDLYNQSGTLEFSFGHGNSGTAGFAELNYINSNGSDAISFMLNNTEKARIHTNGYVGIGTTTPAQQLSVQDKIFVGNGFPAGAGTATSTFVGDLRITGKLDVPTIDPIYRIDGVKYATYGHSTIGVKEEVVAAVDIAAFNTTSGYYESRIAFSDLERGSDLWLFYQATDFGSDWKSLVVSLTPGFDGKVFYEKDVATNTLVIKSSTPGEVSMRLIANRFDHEKWPNLRTDQDDDFTHFEIESK